MVQDPSVRDYVQEPNVDALTREQDRRDREYVLQKDREREHVEREGEEIGSASVSGIGTAIVIESMKESKTARRNGNVSATEENANGSVIQTVVLGSANTTFLLLYPSLVLPRQVRQHVLQQKLPIGNRESDSTKTKTNTDAAIDRDQALRDPR
jgi:hypothetical protein